MATLERRLAIARCALGALIMLWAGVLIGVSFLAAPAKFGAPGLSLPWQWRSAAASSARSI